MSTITLQEKYAALREDANRMASGFGALLVVIEKDPDMAADVCRVFEVYACAVLDEHPRHQEGGEV
jgi:hypothetical protein